MRKRRIIAGGIVAAAVAVATIVVTQAAIVQAQPAENEFANMRLITPTCEDHPNRVDVSGVYGGHTVATVTLEEYDADTESWQIAANDGVSVQVNGHRVDGHLQTTGHATLYYGDVFQITQFRNSEEGYGDGSAETYRVTATYGAGEDASVMVSDTSVIFASRGMCEEFANAGA